MTDSSDEDALKAAVKTVVDQLARLAAADQKHQAERLLIELLPHVWPPELPIERQDELSLYAGLALGYLCLGEAENVLKNAARALIDDPADFVAHLLVPVPQRLGLARELLHHQQSDIGRALLLEIDKTDRSGSARFYLELLDYLDGEYAASKRRACAPSGVPRPTLIHIVVWNRVYVDKFLRFSLPSLLARSNLPALKDLGGATIRIDTGQQDLLALESSPALAAARAHANIELNTLPENLLKMQKEAAIPDADRWIVAAAQYAAITDARLRGSDIIYLGSDSMCSRSFLSHVKKEIIAGYGAVVGAALRAEDGNLNAFLDAQGKRSETEIDIEAEDLLRFATDNIADGLDTLFIQPHETQTSQDPVNIFFKRRNGIATHSFQLAPIIVSHTLLTQDIVCDFHTTDGRFLAEVLSSHNLDTQVKLLDNPADTCSFIGLDEGTSRDFGKFAVTPDHCAQAGVKWCNKVGDFPYFKWAFRQTIFFPCQNLDAFPDSALQEGETVDDILKRYDGAAVKRTHTIDFYRRAPA